MIRSLLNHRIARVAPTAILAMLASQLQAGVVISQVYAGGGAPGALYRNEFVELHNTGGTLQDVSSWSLQFRDGADTEWLSVSIPPGTALGPGEYLLITNSTDTGSFGTFIGGDISAPFPDQDLNRGAVLLNSDEVLQIGNPPTNPGLVDLVGWGTVSYGEGNVTAPPMSSAAQSIARANGGCTDTDNNALDFVAGTVAPRSQGSLPLVCPTNRYVVDTTDMVMAVDGKVSLAEVMTALATDAGVNEANPPASGEIEIELTGGTYYVETALPAINRGFRMVAPNNDAWLYRPWYSSGEFRFFELYGSGKFQFEGIIFQGGRVSESGPSRGGAVYHDGQDTLHFTNCRFYDNSVEAKDGSYSTGGAIYSRSNEAYITGCHFESNQVSIPVPTKGAVTTFSEGGAIYFEGSGEAQRVTITATNFVSNSAVSGTNFVLLGGSAVMVKSAKARVTIDDSLFSKNQVICDEAGGDVDGAAVAILGSTGAMLNIIATQFDRNQSRVDGTPKAIDLLSTVESVIERSSFYAPTVSGTQIPSVVLQGNGPVTLTNNSFDGQFNTVEALFVDVAGNATLINNTVVRCAAGIGFGTKLADVEFLNNYVAGNALFSFDVKFGGLPSTLQASGNFIGVSATAIPEFEEGSPNGNGNYVLNNEFYTGDEMVAGLFGGKTISLVPVPCSSVIDAGVKSGLPTDQRGGERELDGDADGDFVTDIGAVETSLKWVSAEIFRVQNFNSWQFGLGESWDGALDDLGSALELASATGIQCSMMPQVWIQGGTYVPGLKIRRFHEEIDGRSHFPVDSDMEIYGGFCGYEESPSERPGGGTDKPACLSTVLDGSLSYDSRTEKILSVGEVGKVLIDRVTVQNNGTSSRFEEARKGVPYPENAIRASGTETLRLVDVTVRNSVSRSGGAGIYFSGTSLQMTGGEVYDNSTTANGAGILVASGSLTLTNVALNYNTASGDGGAVWAGSGLAATGCDFYYNDVNGSGGAVVCNGVSLFDGCTLEGNYASASGGAIAGFSGSEVTVRGESTLVSNTSIGAGGAISAVGDLLTLEGVLLKDNLSEGLQGGAVRSAAVETRIKASVFTTNSAVPDGAGGAIFLDSPTATIVNCYLTGNTAANGGAIASSSGGVLVHNTMFGNEATSEGGAIFGRIIAVELANNLISSNRAGLSGPDVAGDVIPFSTYNNIIGDVSGSTMPAAEGLGVPLAEILDLSKPIRFATGRDAHWPDFAAHEPIPGSIAVDAARPFTHASIPFDIVGDARSPRYMEAGPDYGAKERGDLDSDGIFDYEEKSVPSASGSSIGALADGNGDDLYDYAQPRVASLLGRDGAGYITLASSSGSMSNVSLVTDPSGGALTPEELDAAPYGWVDFSVNNLTFGESITVDVLLENPLPAGIYDWFKWAPRTTNPIPSLFAFQRVSGTGNGAVFVDRDTTRKHFRLYLTDGEEGDDLIGLPNGDIRDPGAPALATVLAVTLGDFRASVMSQNVLIQWTTIEEVNNAGFHIYRAIPNGSGGFTVGARVNSTMIPAEALGGGGASYSLVDPTPLANGEESRSYFLIDVDLSGAAKRHGPATATIIKSEVPDWSSF